MKTEAPSFIRPLAVLAALSACLPVAHGQVIFSDDFNAGASPSWSNSRGAWLAASGAYSAAIPDNVPPTFSGLPFLVENFSVDVDINQVGDGGIWLRCDESGTNGVLLVTGGNGWGAGARGGNAGRALYWHVITPANWSSPPKLNEALNVFSDPGVENVHLRVEVVGNLYSAFLNGSPNATTVLLETNRTYSSGHVGLYDYSSQTFDNFMLQIPPGFGPYQIGIRQVDASHVALSWTTNAFGWALESAGSLPAGSWDAVTNSSGITGTNFSVTVVSAETRFFRLRKQ